MEIVKYQNEKWHRMDSDKMNESEEGTVKAWIESPGHCRNIMNSNYTEIGVARVGDYWTLVLGTRR